MSTTDPKNPYQIVLPEVRLSFPALFTPTSFEEGQEKKFQARFIFDNTAHGAVLDKLEALIERAALDYWKKKTSFKSCLRDGNEKPELEGYGDGTSFLSANSKTRPPLVDRRKNAITEEANSPFYAGCYVNAVISLWVQDNKFGKRVNANLGALQFVRDGESFGAGKVDTDKAFGDLGMDDTMF